MIKFWIFFLKNRSFTFMLIGVLSIVGIYAALIIPKESSPEVIVPIGVVSTVLRGGSSEDVEKLITNKLEQEIANVENIDKITSNSSEGVSVITAQFIASADVDKSIADLKDAVDRVKVELPTDADEPIVNKVNFSDQPVLIVSVSQDLSPSQLTKLGDDLEAEIKKVKGVSKVEVAGTRAREVQVVISKDKLASFGLSINQIISAVQSANASAPVGRITMGEVNYPIKFEGSIDEPAQIPDITIEGKGGVPVYLRDVAYVSDGLVAPKNYSRISVAGEPSQNALTLNIYKKSGGDVTKITGAALAKIEELKKDAGLLSGAEVVVSLDAGANVKKDLGELSRTGLETIILVMIILFLTIGWRESLVAGLSIPLSFVIAFIGLLVSGNTINFLSLFSLILAIGILVDSGIVVAEAIHTRTKNYPGDPDAVEKAAIESIKEYSVPLIAGTMTTVAAFVPLFFLSGIVGQFVKSIPFTLIFVLLASIFVALGMVPIIATLISKKVGKGDVPKGKLEKAQDEYFEKSQEYYKRFLGSILLSRKKQNRFIMWMLIAFVGSFFLPGLGIVKTELFPQDDQNFVIVTVEKPEGTPLANTDLAVRQIEEVLYGQNFIESFVTTIGAGSTLTGEGGGGNTKIGNVTVILKDKDERNMTSTEITNVLRGELSQINDAKITVSQGNNGPPSGKPIAIKLIGDDLNELTNAALIGEIILNSIEGTQDVSTSVKDDGTQLEITVDRSKAAQYGLSAASVAQILRASVSGVTATTIKKQDTDIDVLVKVALNENFVNPEDTIKTTLDSIKNLPIALPTGGSILLGSVIETTVGPSRTSITHEDQKRITTVSSDIKTIGNAVDVTAEFKKQVEEKYAGSLGEGVTINYGGDNEDIQNTFRDMILALVALLFLMLIILVLEFNSFRYSMYLLSAIPLSLIGVFVGLAVSGQALSFSAMLGIIALAGVIINHAIILLDSILKRLEEEKIKLKNKSSSDINSNINSDPNENKLLDIILESSAIRLRPIILTTITTVVGMIPLAGVSALWGPLAFTIMFGLAFSTLLTLVMIPLLFYRYPGKKFKEFK